MKEKRSCANQKDAVLLKSLHREFHLIEEKILKPAALKLS